MTPQIDCLGKTSTILRVSTHIYGVSQDIDGKMFIGLSFLFIETKELCEARAKLEMSSNFQIYPWGVNLTSHLKLLEDRVNTSLFNVTNKSQFKTVN